MKSNPLKQGAIFALITLGLIVFGVPAFADEIMVPYAGMTDKSVGANILPADQNIGLIGDLSQIYSGSLAQAAPSTLSLQGYPNLFNYKGSLNVSAFSNTIAGFKQNHQSDSKPDSPLYNRLVENYRAHPTRTIFFYSDPIDCTGGF
ncbi:MAG: hypothetical protein WCJ93_06250 [Methanomicrobiales archaeon]